MPDKALASASISAQPASGSDAAFCGEIGRLVRQGRAKRGMTRRQLAQDSGASERYLAQIESGAGNPSVTVMRALAGALDVGLSELLPSESTSSSEFARLAAMLRALPLHQLPEIAELLAQRTGAAPESDRARRIALVGLRGAGKSTLGRMLADKLNVPFIELDRAVEREYGATLPVLIEMSGVAALRRHERACLERVIAANGSAVIATAGGIVSSPETYALLLQRTHTVWIAARPEEHMGRVMQQGDFRPMARNREAMADLVAILEARRGDYARARATVDTSGASVEQSFAKLMKTVTPWLRDSSRGVRKRNEKRHG